MLSWLSGLTETRLNGQRVFCRSPRKSDGKQWRKVRERNRRYLRKVEPGWHRDSTSAQGWQSLWNFYRQGQLNEKLCPFFVFPVASSEELIGGVSITNIKYDTHRSGVIGYWLDKNMQQQGLMTEAVSLVINHGFAALQLHRLSAYCLPDNTPSQRLLLRLGFRQEGLCQDYLWINGQWRDHLLFAITLPHWPVLTPSWS